MSFLDTMKITGSALTAQRLRMDVILQNIANAQTTRTPEGEPYRRKQVVYRERAVNFSRVLRDQSNQVGLAGVRVAEVKESQRDFIPVYDPSHPDANEEGYVLYPNVNSTEERVDLIAAATAYEANLTALGVVKAMAMKALEIGK